MNLDQKTNEESSSKTMPNRYADDREELTDVTGLHAAVLREKGDPAEGNEPVSIWLIALTGTLLFWGGYYLQSYSADFDPLVYHHKILQFAPPDDTEIELTPEQFAQIGSRQYNATCASCHLEDGLGSFERGIPPLDASDWVNQPQPGHLIRIGLHGLEGLIQVNDQEFDEGVAMPAFGSLPNVNLAAVLTHIRSSWSNKAEPVSEDQVRSVRTILTRNVAWTAAELEAEPMEVKIIAKPTTGSGPVLDPKVMAQGKQAYSTFCVACHVADGKGMPDGKPPLAGSDWVLAKEPNRIIRIVLNGMKGPMKVNDLDYGSQEMLPWKAMLDDEQIAAILTYVRNEWGNSAAPVTADQVQAIRTETSSRSNPWSEGELLQVSVTE
ncbi:MAG TPA: c-type cytochrome [Verrucomicrobiales bacterium]|nr:c-type cytochrome [Verrucomicrobiales bacterium]HIL68404.1 c-type cytochrome [Verrucomicrobiota bacterium]